MKVSQLIEQLQSHIDTVHQDSEVMFYPMTQDQINEIYEDDNENDYRKVQPIDWVGLNGGGDVCVLSWMEMPEWETDIAPHGTVGVSDIPDDEDEEDITA